MAGPIDSVACTTVRSGSARRDNSTAPNARLQNSISAAPSRHTSIGITAVTSSSFCSMRFRFVGGGPCLRGGAFIIQAIERVAEMVQHDRIGKARGGGGLLEIFSRRFELAALVEHPTEAVEERFVVRLLLNGHANHPLGALEIF